jgi:hypothetical protein
MKTRTIALDVLIGVAGGIIATRMTDFAEKALWRATPPTEIAREPERLEKSSAGSAARKLIERSGNKPCSFASLAATRTLYSKGAHQANALAFMIATTNLELLKQVNFTEAAIAMDRSPGQTEPEVNET